MKGFGFALAGAIVSALYWWFVTTIAYGLVAGDPGPASPPRSAAAQNATTIGVLVVAILVYALATMAWRRLETRSAAAPLER